MKKSKPKLSRWLQMSAEQVGIYNNWDTLATARLAKRLPLEMAAKGKPDYYAREVWPTVPVVLDMQRRGLAVDDLSRLHIKHSMEMELALFGVLGMARLHALDNRAFDQPIRDLGTVLAELIDLLGVVHHLAEQGRMRT